MRHGAGAESDFSRAGQDHLYLPDASPDRAGSSRQLPNLRDDVGAEKRQCRQRTRERGAARHDAAILDRRSAHLASLRHRNGASVAERADLGGQRHIALDAIRP